MQNVKQPGPRTPGRPSDNDIDVNQTDHISSQLEQEDNDLESGEELEDDVEDDDTPVLDEEDIEENNITDEDAENVEWEDPNKNSRTAL